jgi:hypothetical protein
LTPGPDSDHLLMNPLEGILVVTAGPFPLDNYTWGNDQLGPSWGWKSKSPSDCKEGKPSTHQVICESMNVF